MAKISVFNRDCKAFLQICKENTFDLCFSDPPYRDKNSPTKDMRRFGEMKDFGDRPDGEFFELIRSRSKNQIVFGANNFIENLESTNCFVFWNKHNAAPNFSDGELLWTSFNYPAKLFNYRYNGMYDGNKATEPKIQQTQKPVAIYRWLLKNFAKPGDTILDTHGGSLSVAIACIKENYDLVVTEISKERFNNARDRINSYLSQMDFTRPAVEVNFYD